MMARQCVNPVFPHDTAALREIDRFYGEAGIRRDEHLDYLAVVRDERGRLLAAGGFYGQSLRSLAVLPSERGQGHLLPLLDHLLGVLRQRGIFEFFLFSRAENAPFFSSLGFSEIVRDRYGMIFMEYPADGFRNWLQVLRRQSADLNNERAAALVMNLNPITLGHLALIRRATEENGRTHLFLLSEDRSEFSLAERRAMLERAVEGMAGLVIHESGAYMVSHATFPSYFLKKEDSSSEAQAHLDAAVFLRVARALGVSRRYAGDEPYSAITDLYNRVLAEELARDSLDFVVVKRLTDDGGLPISASRVRALLAQGRREEAFSLTPPAIWPFLERHQADAAANQPASP